MFLASSYFRPCPTSPLLTYTSPPPSCTSTTTTTTLIENLSKLLLLPSQKKRTARHFPLPAATTSTTATTNITISTIQSTPTTPITIDRSAPVNVPTAKVASLVVSYPPDQTNILSAKDAQRNCTEPRSPFTRKLDDDYLSYRFLPAPDTRNPCSNHIQISRPSRTVNRFTASTCSFPPDPVPLATFSYSEIPFLDDLQLEIGDDQQEHDGKMSDRTMGYLPMRRSQEPPARRRLLTKPSTVDYSVYLPSSSHLFSPSLSPSSFFTPTIPPAVHLLIARKNLPPILYESVQKSHEAIVQGFRSPIQPKLLNRQDPPPRSQVRDVRSNPAHYLMRATETRMILARKLAAPLKSRAVLPRRRVSFAHCGSRLVVTT